MLSVREVRTAVPEDQAILDDLHRRASYVWEEDRAQLDAHPDAIGVDAAALGAGCVRVALDAGGRIVGFATVRDGAEGAGELEDLFVEPEAMRQGVGRRLLTDAIDRARARGLRELAVVAHPRTLPFYTRFGFVGGESAPTRFGPALRLRCALSAVGPGDPGSNSGRDQNRGLVRMSTQPMSNVPALELNDGHEIPQLGFGVFQIPPEETAEAVSHALEVGYRHIDTAEMYRNERGVGEAVRASGLDRGELFITSKLNNGYHRPDDARRAFADTLEELGSDYVDLFLIHWPLPTLYDGDFVSTWKVLEEFKQDGRARSIGVSNFQVPHLERLAAETTVVPAVNQIELHPYFLNDAVRSHGETHGIATEAWSPIAQGGVLDDPAITTIAQRLDRTPAQVVLRWHIERGSIVFPKSTTPARIEENFRLFDFTLEADDIETINGLDRGEDGRTGPNPDRFAYIPD